jgi:hypothetical protein
VLDLMRKNLLMVARLPGGHTWHVLLCLLSILMAGSCSVAHPTNLNDWATYTNEQHGYSFDYPPEVQVQAPGKDNQTFQLNLNAEPLFEITAKPNELPGDAIYFLDTPSVVERQIGDLVWSAYLLPDGYCDGPNCSPAIYALRIGQAQMLYTIILHGQRTTNDLQESIVATFHFVEQIED